MTNDQVRWLIVIVALAGIGLYFLHSIKLYHADAMKCQVECHPHVMKSVGSTGVGDMCICDLTLEVKP